MELSQLNILYKNVFPKFKSWIINNLGTSEDAHDTFQEVLEMILIKNNLGKLSINSSLEAYVFKACKFRWIDHLRKIGRQGRVISLNESLHNSIQVQEDIQELEDEKKKYDLLDQAFNQLTDICRKVLIMVKQGVKPAEIAIQMGATNAKTINRRKFACMESWKKNMATLKLQSI